MGGQGLGRKGILRQVRQKPLGIEVDGMATHGEHDGDPGGRETVA